jgi:hypothetical protein
MPYLGGNAFYQGEIDAVAAKDYEGFEFDRTDAELRTA